MSEIEENFAYLREVLGVKYLPLNYVSETSSGGEFQPESLADIRRDLGDCTRCKLSQGRKTIVFGDGAENARLLFVGEGPGEHEDARGLPFVGPAGQLLNKMINAMGFQREEVYVANVVKCRPPLNREPELEEISTCAPFLKRQIEAINPEVVLALGSSAAQCLLQTTELISTLRGRVHLLGPRKLVATFHPSYLLRNPAEKKAAWADLQLVMSELGIKK